MGIIQRQSVKSSAVNFTGFVIGSISTLFIFPLNWEVYGSIQYWIALATLLFPFLSWGTYSLVEKYFPYFKERQIPGFLRLILTITLGALAINLLLLFAVDSLFPPLSELLFGSLKGDREKFVVILISICMVFISIFRIQAANHKRIVVTDLTYKLGFKLYLPLVFCLFIYSWMSYTQLQVSIVLFHAIVVLILLFYLVLIGGWDFSTNQAFVVYRKKWAELKSYMFFGMFSELSHLLAYKIDVIMISILVSRSGVGIFSSFLFLSAILEIPARSIYEISAPFVASGFEKNDMDSVKELYRKASINLTIVGVLLFSLIWLNIESVFDVMSNGDDLRPVKWVFFFLGIAKLMDLMTSLNKHILVYSKYYRFNLYFVLLMAFINLVLNYFFIQIWGLVGAGIATSISIFTFQLGRSIFIAYRLKMHPLSMQLVPSILVLIAVSLIAPFIHQLEYHWFIKTLVISSVFSLLYLALMHFLGISKDLENMFLSKLPFGKNK